MVNNKNRVAQKQWKKWSDTAQRIFNDVYEFCMLNPTIMVHPKAEKIQPEHWKTIAWNTAWVAADSYDEVVPDLIVTGTETYKVKRTRRAAKRRVTGKVTKK